MPLPSRPGIEAHVPSDPSTLRILAVCSGNICRSPLLEQLLRIELADLAPDASIQVTSAGTIARDGQSMDPLSAAEGERLGVDDVAAHRSRRLRQGMIEEADLIIALAAEHRSEVVGLVPTALPRTFTLLELARLVRHVAGDPDAPSTIENGLGLPALVRATVHRAARSRSVLAMHPDPIDVQDPIGLGPEVHRRSAESIAHAVREIVDGLVDRDGRRPRSESSST